MNYEEELKELELLEEQIDILDDIFIKYGDEIKNAHTGVVFANDDKNEFKVEWIRSEYSKVKSFIFYYDFEFLKFVYADIQDHANIIVCTPQSTYQFIENALSTVETNIMLRRYEIYKKKMEVFECG